MKFLEAVYRDNGDQQLVQFSAVADLGREIRRKILPWQVSVRLCRSQELFASAFAGEVGCGHTVVEYGIC